MDKPKERPLLFSGLMVQALLAGRKTMTRRVVKPQPEADLQYTGITIHSVDPSQIGKHGWSKFSDENPPRVLKDMDLFCPYGQPGDRLYVRETWRPVGDAPLSQCTGPEDISFAASADEVELAIHRWRPSIHMPRWASRILLEITAVRVERLQDISEEDARAEGAKLATHNPHGDYWWAFKDLWASINGAASWDANPWTWCISFKRIDI